MISADPYILRPYENADAPAMAAAVRESVDSVGRWMTWAKADFSEYDALCWFEHCRQARASGQAHEFGIFDRDGGFVGGCGLNQFCGINKVCNLGYWVRQSCQRAGAATAAVWALRDLALGPLAQARVEVVVAEGNLASLAVARKAGAVHECLAELGELAGPVVGTGAGFHGDNTRRQRGNQLEQLAARHRRAQQHGLAFLIASMHGKHVLGEIDADGQNGHGPSPFRKS